MKIAQFAGKEPRFRPEEYFLGRSRAWGLFEDRFGNLRREFVLDITGSMEGDTLVLEEDVRYADGETGRRVWRMAKRDEHRYEAHGDDVVGPVRCEARGNAFHWSYRMDLEVGRKTWRVGFEDWMFLQSDGVLLNRAEMTKCGVLLGTVTASFMRLPEDGDQPSSLTSLRVSAK